VSLWPWQANSIGKLRWFGSTTAGELRVIALAPKTHILYYVAFVDRGEARRVISLRRANRREVKHYVQNI
jgi:uncharacterized DUF497 family protein